MSDGTVKKSWIPEVPKSDILELAKRIKPVVRFAIGLMGRFKSPEGKPYFIKPVDPFTIAFMWSPKPRKVAKGLKKLVDITTYHTWTYYGMFKPSIAEVLAQIPADIVDRVVAFEIIDYPETAGDLNRNLDALNAGYHVAVTRLYTR